MLTALLQMLAAVAANCVNDDRRAAVKAQIDLVVRASQERTAPADRALVAGAAARNTYVVEHPGTLPPPPSAFGMVAAAEAAEASTDGDSQPNRLSQCGCPDEAG